MSEPVSSAPGMPQAACDRVLVIGDVGGHRTVLETLLRRIGADRSAGTIPPGWRVVQVGDLVHRGPDSPGVVDLVDRMLRGRDGARWTQLAGNHEAQYLRPGGATFVWPERLPSATVGTIRGWWAEGLMQVAADANGVLVTHAGLTWGFWQALQYPATAALAAQSLNALPRGSRGDIVWREGLMVLGTPLDDAGPMWASSTGELVPSWLPYVTAHGGVPFGQAVGHSAMVDWASGSFRTDDAAVAERLHPVPEHALAWADMGVDDEGRPLAFWGIDAGHGTQPATAWGAIVVDPDGTVRPLTD